MNDVEHPAGDDLSDADLRAALHRVADWIADYRRDLAARPISPSCEPGDVVAAFPDAVPATGQALDTLLAVFERTVVPNLVHWGHPAFLGYFGSTTTGPGVVAEALAAALNVSAMTWRVSPAATELETVVLRWLAGMLGLASDFHGIVYDTGSVATLHALAAARERAGDSVRRDGLRDAPPMTIYTSDQGHSSIEKAAIVLGLGERNVRRVASDDAQRMDVTALRRAMDADRRAGIRSCAVVATVGTTSTAAVDPVAAIADACAEHACWLHVDAAYGGAMAVLPEGRWVFDGVERSDSVVVNPHKWLFVPLDFSTLYTRHPETIRRVFSLTPSYLDGDAGGAGMPDAMDYSLQLGRRFRALKAWMVWSACGRDGLEARIRRHVELARMLAGWIEADPQFELVAPVHMGVVCLRARGTGTSHDVDRLNDAIVATVNRTGIAYLTATSVGGHRVVRVGFGNVRTSEADVARAWTAIQRARATLLA